MASQDIRLKDKSLNGTHRIQFAITKDGVVWTGIDSVDLTLYPPSDMDGTGTTHAMTESGTPGTWYYDTVSGDLDETGYWSADVEVTDGTVILEYPYDIGFRVNS